METFPPLDHRMIIAINNTPATATADIASDVSRISRRFLSGSNFSGIDGPVFRGRVFVTREPSPVFVDLELLIVDSLAYDVVLGSDWHRLAEDVSSNVAVASDPSSRRMDVDEFPVDEEMALSQSEERGYDLIYTNIFGQANAVNAVSLSCAVPVFQANLWQLKHLMNVHGLDPTGKDIGSCRQELLAHLIMGGCVSHRTASEACRLVASEFSHSSELSLAILCELSESKLASVWPTEHLRMIASALGITVKSDTVHFRAEVQSRLRDRMRSVQIVENKDLSSLTDIFRSFERHDRGTLLGLCSQHSIPVTAKTTSENMRHLLCDHLVSGLCTITDGVQCYALRNQWLASAGKKPWTVFFLSNIVNSRVSLKPLQRLLKSADIPFRADESLSQLRSTLRAYIKTLSKGKCAQSERPIDMTYDQGDDPVVEDIRRNWPRTASPALKDELIRMFQERTSSMALSSGTCACCAENVLNIDLEQLTTDDFDYHLLTRPDDREREEGKTPVAEWLAGFSEHEPTLPLANNVSLSHFRDILLDPCGILEVESEERLRLNICKTCSKPLRKGRVPALALANRTFLGETPDELKDLTVVEEAMIARCRAKCWIVQLKEEFSNIELPNGQRGVKGHIVIYPQNTSDVAKLLPPPIEEITAPICVLFVGSHPPTPQWLREKAKPLAVRPAVVRRALEWLKTHNPLYKDIIINEPVLQSLADTDILPFSVQHVQPSRASETQTSRYDAMGAGNDDNDGDVSWQNVIIANVDGEASSNALRAAAFQHVRNKKGGYIQIPHDPTPVNEFIDPKLFPMIYPTLFPYGIGGFKDHDRETPLSMQRHVKHLFNLRDRRFQEHYSFLFTAFNMLQRHSILLYTKLKTQRSNFDKLAVTLADVDASTIHTVIERMGRGESVNNQWSPTEAKLFSLMREVSALTSNVPGSASARTTMRNEIRAMMVDKGLPNFYLTINPADVYNPIVNLLAGSEIDVDNLLDKDLPGYWQQSTLVAKNPAVTAKFFDLYMKAFISCLLRYDPDVKEAEEGVLGVVKAYYGCVEAQGRGTLHCHMLVWVEGGLNPNELKDKVLADKDFQHRLLAYLDDSICNSVPPPPEEDIIVPSDRHHPCSVRGVRIGLDGLDKERELVMRQKDMSNLVDQCQTHTHTRTCFKYFKGAPGERKECRFDLDEKNVRPVSSVDEETGEILLRKVNGMVNNFNPSILEALRCNMDIQFIGSGASAKAMIYYMTDYITKSALKTHVALGALELAVNQMEKYVPDQDDASFRAKVLLRKCAYLTLSHQELSAPQVASYIMGYEDHYKSHNFATLFWPSSERFIDSEDPSPECSSKKGDRCSGNDIEQSKESVEDVSQDDVDENEVEPDGIENGVEDDDGRPGFPSLDEEIQAPVDSGDPNPKCRSKKRDRCSGNDIEPSKESVEHVSEDDVNENEVEPAGIENGVDDDDGRPGFPSLDEEVQISVDSEGQIVASTDLTEDYRLRGRALKDINLWEFRARIEKVKITKALKTIATSSSYTEAPYFLHRKQIYVPLMSPHRQSQSHMLRFTPFGERLIPVPVGPKIPRRDSIETLPRFCRLMLLLFKPWYTARDLRQPEEPWPLAYDNFIRDAPKNVLFKIENTQILHECRDSRDHHFAERRNRRRYADLGQGANDGDGEVSFVDAPTYEELLNHLQQIQSCYEEKTEANQHKMLECLNYAEKYGIFESSNFTLSHPADENAPEVMRVTDDSMEDVWDLEYEKRRDAWKKKAAICPINSSLLTASANAMMPTMIADGSSLRECEAPSTERVAVPQIPHIQQNVDNTPVRSLDLLESVSNEWNLNCEQRRAFKIVAEHSAKEHPEQLQMFVGGFGGAGKSRIIKALCDFFDRSNQSRRLRLASFTGIAARNIGGVTLHASLFINQRTNKGSRAKSLRDLIAVWEGVDYLLIDEVSMIGCALLYDVSKSLSEAKSNSHPFGGINIIFAGDFAQLPPVCETRLYARLNPRSTGGKSEQKKILGKLLWLSVDTVVILWEVMRQAGAENRGFVELLARLRNGRCTTDDFSLLNSRLISRTNAICNDAALLKNTPILVTQNSIKDFLNEKGVESFSRRMRRSLHWYYAIDKINGKVIDEEQLKAHLRGLSTSHTSQRLGRLPLVIGMPVMITQNFDVEHGVVNGTIGTLKSIRYEVDNQGDRHATSCVVQIPDMTGPKLINLEAGEAAVIRDTVSMTFRHPFSGKNCTIKRLQLPLVPAFCLTAHKSQGQTMDRVIVDLEDCRGTEAPYVMLSRVKSLDGLHILRPFQYKRITVHPSQESRTEFQRLEILRLQTLQKYGTETEKIDATKALNGARLSFQTLRSISGDDINNAESRRLLADAQRSVVEQTAILGSGVTSLSGSNKRMRSDAKGATRRVRRRIN